MTEFDPRHPLAGIAAKIDRADFHFQTLEDEIRRFLDSPPYSFAMEADEESGWHSIIMHVHRQMPLALGAILGDYVHNLRSALDHLIWQIVLGLGNAPDGRTAFPIYDSRPNFEKSVEKPYLKGKPSPLLGVDQETFTKIERFQPYHAPDRSRHNLGILRDLSNIDKHRILHGSYVRISEQDAEITGEGWVVTEIEQPAGVVEDGAEVLRLRAWSDRPDPEMDLKVTLPLDVAFGDIYIPRRQLHELRNAVMTVLNMFARGFS